MYVKTNRLDRPLLFTKIAYNMVCYAVNVYIENFQWEFSLDHVKWKWIMIIHSLVAITKFGNYSKMKYSADTTCDDDQ